MPCVTLFKCLTTPTPQQNPTTPTLYMAILPCTPLPFLSLRTTLTSTLTNPPTTRIRLFLALNTFAKFESVSSSTSSSSSSTTYQQVPEQNANDMDCIADNMFHRYTSNVTKRSGKKTSIVWIIIDYCQEIKSSTSKRSSIWSP